MNPAPHGRHTNVQQQLAELLGPLARAAGLLPRVGPFNLGEPDDYRVPDGGLQRAGTDRLYYPTAALVVEIVSRGDETYSKLKFYGVHGVDELLIIDPQERRVEWLGLVGGSYEPLAASHLIELVELTAKIDWP